MYYDSYLAHYGVKGMKWGVRRARKKAAARSDKQAWKAKSKKERKQTRDQANKRYTKSDRELDKSSYGSGGVKRINRRMNKGQTHGQAARREFARQYVTKQAAGVGLMAGLGIYKMGPEGRKAVANVINNAAKMKAQDLINSAKAANAARQARNMIPRLADGVEKTIKLKPWQYKVR